MKITLKTLPQATPQQVFDQVALHLLTQGQPSIVKEPVDPEESSYIGCAYRGPNGLMCAAGCLVSDDEYRAGMEGKAWGALAQYGTCGVPKVHLSLIADLQRVHDDRPSREWDEGLREVAVQHQLSARVVDEFNN